MDSFADKLSGKAKQVAGDATGNDKLKTEGKLEEAKGAAKETFADIKKKVTDTIDEVKEKHDK